MESEEEYDGVLIDKTTNKQPVENTPHKKKRKIKKTKTNEENDSKKAKIDNNNKDIKTKEKDKRPFKTVSIAIPSSILDSCLSMELQTLVVGHIARIATIFQINEIIVYNDGTALHQNGNNSKDPNAFFMKILQYIETPLYLRKALFTYHPDLKHVGVLSPIYAPHHLDANTWSEYREGITVHKPVQSGKIGTYVNIGLMRDAFVMNEKLKPGIRVTLKLDKDCNLESKKYTGKFVSPLEPYKELNKYWGYTTRYSNTFHNVYENCPFKDEKYDFVIGTSRSANKTILDDFVVPEYKHMLILFGGIEGIYDLITPIPEWINEMINICPNQGSNIIKTEEAVGILLSSIQKYLPMNC